jgi:uncharacterized circularly permuted ATP-grasp superfamily protein
MKPILSMFIFLPIWFKLVEGSDLLVREGTIDQLERVDVIIKRIDDQWCDPLELNKIHY